MREKCKYEKFYDDNLRYTIIGSSFDEYLKIKVPCMNCSEKNEFGKMYNVGCSNECSFYHKYICNKCKENSEN